MKVTFLKNNNVSFTSGELIGFKFKPRKYISTLNIIDKSMINYILLKKINKELLNCEKAINLIIKSNVAIESDCDIMLEEIIRIIQKLDSSYLLYFSEFEFFDIMKKLYLLYQVVTLKKRMISFNNE